MNEGYKITDQNTPYFLTFQVIDWVDVFTRFSYKEIIVDAFDYCRKNKGLILYSYVIMSNHIHLIAQAKPKFELSDIIRDFKGFTAKQIIDTIKSPGESRRDWMLKRFEFAAMGSQRNLKYQFWTHENHPVDLYSQEFIKQKMDYIHFNPVRAKIVEKPEDYIYSSARNYAQLPSRIEIDMIW